MRLILADWRGGGKSSGDGAKATVRQLPGFSQGLSERRKGHMVHKNRVNR